MSNITILFSNSSPKLPKPGIFGQKFPSKAFLVPNLDIFVFLRNFAIDQIRGMSFQI